MACHRYQETGLSLDNGGSVGDPHVVGERCLVFLCILHCCMTMSRDLLRDLYSHTPSRADLRAAQVKRAYPLHCCKAA